jgi:vacuolar-type H+-ATPase subunit E/Vma4
MATAMSDNDRQINQMMEFIMEEANEKAEEIRQKATAEYESQFQELKREVEYVSWVFFIS